MAEDATVITRRGGSTLSEGEPHEEITRTKITMTSHDEDIVECWSAGVLGARNLEVARAEGAESWVAGLMFMLMKT